MASSKTYYRRRSDGQLGYLTPDGDIRLDRASQDIRSAVSNDWVPEEAQKPLSRFETAQVAWAADVMVCRFLGVPLKQKDWLSLTDEQKIEFTKRGPSSEPEESAELRARIYRNIREALADFERS